MNRARSRVAFLCALALPVVGVLQFDWTLTTIAAFVWLEIGVVLGLSAFECLFAQRPFEYGGGAPGLSITFDGFFAVRGGRDVHRRLPPVYPRNVPILHYYLGFVAIWLVFGAVAIGVVADQFWSHVDGLRGVTLTAAVLGTIVARGVIERDAYFGERAYERCSMAPLNHRAMEFLAVGALIVLWALHGSGSGSGLIVLVVGTKIGYELLRNRPGQLLRYDNALTRRGGYDPPPERRPPAEVPASFRPTETTAPDRSATVRAGLRRALRSDLLVLWAPFFVVLVALFAWFVTIVDGWTPLHTFLAFAVAAMFVAGAFVAVPLMTADHLVRSRWTTYRFSEDGMLAVNGLVDEPQWYLDFEQIDAVSVDRTPADQRYDTGTVVIETADGTRRLPQLSDAEVVHDRLRNNRPRSTSGQW